MNILGSEAERYTCQSFNISYYFVSHISIKSSFYSCTRSLSSLKARSVTYSESHALILSDRGVVKAQLDSVLFLASHQLSIRQVREKLYGVMVASPKMKKVTVQYYRVT